MVESLLSVWRSDSVSLASSSEGGSSSYAVSVSDGAELSLFQGSSVSWSRWSISSWIS